MDASVGRIQTTKGIWIDKALDMDPFTIVIDIEGTDSGERGPDDTTFEKQSLLFTLAVTDIILINMWCHHVGLVRAADRLLLKIVFQVMLQLFNPRKTTLLFVIRDKTKTPFECLEAILREDIWKIWDEVPKPEAHKHTPLTDFFNVEVTSLSSYEEKETQFKEEVAELRQRFFHSISPGGLAGGRQSAVPASGFAFSVENIWNAIKENKNLDLPNHNIMVATVRCEEIADEKFKRLKLDEEWLNLKQSLQTGAVSSFGECANSLLKKYMSEYDMETLHFEEGVRSCKRLDLEKKAMELVRTGYIAMLKHLRSGAFERFKTGLEEFLYKGRGFASSFLANEELSMRIFDNGCSDAAIEQANWDDVSKVREKVCRDIKDHAFHVREERLSNIMTDYEKRISEAISGPLNMIFQDAKSNTWASVRKLLKFENNAARSRLLETLAGYGLDQTTTDNMLNGLEDHAIKLVWSRSRVHAEGKAVLIRMKDRFSTAFNRDKKYPSMAWGGRNIRAITMEAHRKSLKLLSAMAAVCLVEREDSIENVLFSELIDNQITDINPLASNTWEELPPENTLIKPFECKVMWDQFLMDTDPIVTQAILAEETSRKWLPPTTWMLLSAIASAVLCSKLSRRS